VRFNPDSYFKNKTKIKSYENREKQLQTLLIQLKNRNEKYDSLINVYYLFYNQYDESDEIKCIPLYYKPKKNNIEVIHKHPNETSKKHFIDYQ
ncbi:MAG: hypothetical protein WBA74_18775, partial [Cyclobacteriaceae bacterium]